MFEMSHDAVSSAQPPPLTLQFITVEIMPTGDGVVAVSLLGSYLDEERFEFINDEIAAVRTGTLDEAMTVIRNAVAGALGLGGIQGGH